MGQPPWSPSVQPLLSMDQRPLHHLYHFLQLQEKRACQQGEAGQKSPVKPSDMQIDSMQTCASLTLRLGPIQSSPNHYLPAQPHPSCHLVQKPQIQGTFQDEPPGPAPLSPGDGLSG